MNKNELRKEIGKLTGRLNVMHLEDENYMLNSEQFIDELLALFQKEKEEMMLELIKIMQKEIDAESWDLDRGDSEIPSLLEKLKERRSE